MGLDVLTAIRERQSVRAYTKQTVTRATIEAILDTARFAPSGVNTQPWQVVVLQSDSKQRVSRALLNAYQQDLPMQRDYDYYPNDFPEPYKTRRFNCGMALYGALGIKREEKEKRRILWEMNYHFFHAPVALLFFIDNVLAKGSWVDLGMFIQNVMLAARGHGLETCPQAAIADYANTVRETINYQHQHALVCGMAMGYGDFSQAINQYRTEREPISTFTSWLD